MTTKPSYAKAVPFRTVRGIPVHFNIEHGVVTKDLRFVMIVESGTNLKNDLGDYVGTSMDYIVQARIGHRQILGEYRVRHTRYTSERPRWFAKWRLNRAINKAVNLLK